MRIDIYDSFRNIRFGILFSLLTLLYGFGLVVSFAVFEEDIKDIFIRKAEYVMQSTYNGDEAKMKLATNQAWKQLNDSRLHAFSLGTASLALCILLAFLSINDNMKALVGFLLGAGALGYALYWLWVAIRIPEYGSILDAKSSIRIVGQLSSGASILGLTSMAIGTIQNLFKRHF